jgi:small subunit ribosomal protein S6
MPLYELGVILDPEATPDQESGALERLEKIITDAGGDVVNKDARGRRKLAFPIQKRTMGVYHFWRFNAEGTVQEPLGFELRTNDVVLRSLVLNLDREMRNQRKLDRVQQAKIAKKAARGAAAVDAEEES